MNSLIYFYLSKVGSLTAIHLGKRNHIVHVYECNSDPRNLPIILKESGNVTLSIRARKALNEIGLEESVVRNCIEIHGELYHNGNELHQTYDNILNKV